MGQADFDKTNPYPKILRQIYVERNTVKHRLAEQSKDMSSRYLKTKDNVLQKMNPHSHPSKNNVAAKTNASLRMNFSLQCSRQEDYVPTDQVKHDAYFQE